MPVMAERRNVVVIRQQGNDSRPGGRTTLNIALAISLGLVAVVAIALIFYLLRRSREKNQIQASASGLAQRLRESQVSTVPVLLPNDGTRGMRSLDSYRSSTWKTGQQPSSAFGERQVLPRDSMRVSVIGSARTFQSTQADINHSRINSTVVMSRPLPDAPTTALYSTSRESAILSGGQPPNLTRRPVSNRPQVPQDVNDGFESSKENLNYSRFSSTTEYADPSPKSNEDRATSSASGSISFRRASIGNPFARDNDDFFDGTFTASSIVRSLADEAEAQQPESPPQPQPQLRDSNRTLGLGRTSLILTGNSISSVATSIAGMPPLPPPPKGPASENGTPQPNRRRHSSLRPSMDADSIIAAARMETQSSPMPTVPEKEAVTSSAPRFVDMKRRGPLKMTARRKERPSSLMVPAIPRRLDVIVTASPGPMS